MTRYPDISVELTGNNGNAFAIVYTVTLALKEAKVSQIEIDEFSDEAFSGNYDHLLKTCIEWVDCQ